MAACFYLVACWKLLCLSLLPSVASAAVADADALLDYWSQYSPAGDFKDQTYFFTKFVNSSIRTMLAKVEPVRLAEAPSAGNPLNLPVYTIQTSGGAQKHMIPGWYNDGAYRRHLSDLVSNAFCYLVAKADLPGFDKQWFQTPGPPGVDDRRGAVYCKAAGPLGQGVTHPKAMIPDMVCGWNLWAGDESSLAKPGWMRLDCVLNWPAWCFERKRPWMKTANYSGFVVSECRTVCRQDRFKLKAYC
ncbi:hypothetical protein BCR37DRAFT_377552 [Protomyces lactucae-debilis]|uniref:Uncharacterized protein n=1 Tax=Protomyces lactucae-debilis TaxID=2754530 RepID=A0A1Y2FN62_PROLT|nr:uncharacterized protein BCR37DRAFT_377552 [Protomyces lactucae-debilis]ORY84784.1 hypothetical protein BCR37DRAFT_377552 [Protomyces lactucae-debilis]